MNYGFYSSRMPEKISENHLISQHKKYYSDNFREFNFNNNSHLDNSINIRKNNNFLSKENKKLKNENKILEENIKSQKYNQFQNGKDSINLIKKKFKNIMNNNDILVYKILNDAKDIYLLKNNIYKNNHIYNNIKLSKLDIDKMILNYKKEELKLKIIELKNRKKNLDILHNSVIQKMEDGKEIISKLNNIIEQINFKNNYINNSDEIYQKINLLLNEKQKLIEENINLINNISNKKKDNKDESYKNNNKENEEIIKLRNKNEKLKNLLNKYNDIINRTNLLLNNASIRRSIENNKNINNEIIKVTQQNENIDNEIENMINKFKNEIQKKDELIERLKNEYIKLKKEDMNSIDNLIL